MRTKRPTRQLGRAPRSIKRRTVLVQTESCRAVASTDRRVGRGAMWGVDVGIRLSLRHGQVLPPLIAPQPSAALPIAPRPAPMPPQQHALRPPRQPKLRVGGGPLWHMRARVGSCESRYATPKNRAGENPVTGSGKVSYPRFDPLRDEFQPCRRPSPNTSAS